MSSCPNFIANTFLHVLGAVGLTAAGTQFNIIPVEDPKINVVTLLGLIVLIFVQSFLQPSIFKYLIFGLFILLLSQVIRPLEDELQQKGLLFEVLIMSLGIFIPMVILGFSDKLNTLGWTNYLFFSLVGLIVARILLYVLALTGYYSDKDLTTTSKVLSTLAIGLFGLFTTWDVNVIRMKAKLCKGNPDYVDSSMGLFLDLLNLFSNLSDVASN